MAKNIIKPAKISAPSSPFATKSDVMDLFGDALEKVTSLVSRGGLEIGGFIIVIMMILKPDSFKWLTDQTRLKSIVGLVKSTWDFMQPIWEKLFSLDDEKSDAIDQVLDILAGLLGQDAFAKNLGGLVGGRF